MMDVNSGYIGHSMSRRAAEAYEDGEMPNSKWTKKAMVAAIQSYCDEFDMSFDPDVLKGMRKDDMFERFFHKSSWHHTSKFFNETDFYKLDEDAVCGSFRPMTDAEFGETTHELAGQFARHVATYHSVDELSSAGYLDNENLLDVSSTEKLFETGLAIGTAEASDIDLLVKRDIEEGHTVYAHDRGIAIASYLDDVENPRIEVSHYTPYELASLVNARMAPDASDIRDALTDPSRPRAFDHEVATFDSIDDFLAKMGSPTSISQKWLPMCGDRLEPSMVILDIKQTDNVREWYTLAFPGDELAVAINPSLTFDDAITAVPTGDGFYTALGDAADSLLRERIFEELCNRYGYTYDEVYDSWLHESPLPSPAISQQPEKIAVAAGYRFNLVDAREASGIDLKGCGTVVTVDGHDYEIMKGATYEDSRKVDDLLDSHGDKPISAFRKQPQGMSLKQAAMEAREASAKLFDKNVGADSPTRRDER